MPESIELPQCPHCWCKRSELVEIKEAWRMTCEYRRCGNPRCGRTFRHTPTFTYDSDPVRCVCPNCRAKNPAVTKVIQRTDERSGDPAGTIRYHKCEGCDFTFKTVDRAR